MDYEDKDLLSHVAELLEELSSLTEQGNYVTNKYKLLCCIYLTRIPVFILYRIVILLLRIDYKICHSYW